MVYIPFETKLDQSFKFAPFQLIFLCFILTTVCINESTIDELIRS